MSGVINGKKGNDSLTGTAGNDTLAGGQGNDWLEGGAGNDVLKGGAGADTLVGGAGNNVYTGGAGPDVFMMLKNAQSIETVTDFDRQGGDRVDVSALGIASLDALQMVQGAKGVHINLGGGQVLTLEKMKLAELQAENFIFAIGAVEEEDHLIEGLITGMVVKGGRKVDLLTGADGDDALYGENGSDTLSGKGGNDKMDGGRDNDLLFGDGGDDQLLGGHGSDTLEGGRGNDVMTGGYDNDVFVIGRETGALDVITDFDSKGDDIIDLRGLPITAFEQLHMVQDKSGVHIDLGQGQRLLLEKAKLADMDATDFLLAEGERIQGTDALAGRGWEKQWYTLQAEKFQYADINGDGDLEFIELTNGQVWKRDNDVWQRMYEGNNATAFQMADTDNNGQAEFFGLFGTQVWRFDSGIWSRIYQSTGATDFQWVDFDNDGKLEFVGLFGDRISGFDEVRGWTTMPGSGAGLTDFHFANIDGDAALEMIGVYGNKVKLYNDGVTTELANAANAKSVQYADIDRDGEMEFLGRYDDAVWSFDTGYSGKDTLVGSDGHDTLIGGSGDDHLTGGLGQDTFQFTNGFGKDTITDFAAGDRLAIHLTGVNSAAEVLARASQAGGDVILDFGAEGSIKLANMLLGALTEESIIV